LGAGWSPKYRPEFSKYIQENSLPFNRMKGMCTGTYERAHTYGPAIKPFRKFK